ncbi:ExbD/TolR family protein [Gynuella sunshinyii]|uniref:Biopolymer transport protein n=1 Tax=Gynuella sunshinyii YC6258 TaxID=1445510 RepID=A0A0C5V2S9_9GAMM|nr:biopolymer transporter ExbD [Gynuella sunshinyii]AJQ93790.1 biopolymer transport protein [Gynuella sunshinyii YC6258]
MELGYRARKASISLTPLIDVVFILLLFFMLSSRFQLDQGIALKLPAQNRTAPVNNDDIKPLRVQVDRFGLLHTEDGTFSAEQLVFEFPERSHKSVIVAAESGVNTQRLLTAMEELQAQGLQNIKLERPHAR